MAEYTGEVLDKKPEQAPAGAVAAPSMDEQFAEKERKLREEYDRKVKEATTSQISIGDNKFEVPSFFTSPAGLITGGAALVGTGATLYGAGKVAPAVYQGIKDRWITKTPEVDRTVDVPFDTGIAPVQQPATMAPTMATEAPVDRLQQAQQRIEEGRQAGLGIKPPVEVPPSAVPTPTPAPMTVEQLDAAFRGQNISTPLTSAPIDAPAPLPSAAPGSAVTEVVADTLKELIQEPVAPSGQLMTGTGKPAFAGQGPEPKINKRTGKPQFKAEYGSIAEVPQGYALIPNAQYIDALRQDLGQAEYTKAFTGRDFPTNYEQAVATGKEINRSLGRATREEAKAAGQAYGEITPGIAQRTTSGKKIVNVGGKAGIAGALVALSDLAKAETAGQRGMAGANLLEAVLPPTMMMSGAGEGSSTVPSQDAALLLGSPYAFSEAGKKFRQDQAYTRKVGAGRGIAPPSAYKR